VTPLGRLKLLYSHSHDTHPGPGHAGHRRPHALRYPRGISLHCARSPSLRRDISTLTGPESLFPARQSQPRQYHSSPSRLFSERPPAFRRTLALLHAAVRAAVAESLNNHTELRRKSNRSLYSHEIELDLYPLLSASSIMASVEEVPIRVAPIARMRRRSSKLRIPPDALTCTPFAEWVTINSR
jgi:hypothetical protein